MKKEICEYMQANPNKKQTDIALHFNTKYSEKNIDRSTIAKIWQDRNKWLAVLSNFQTTHTFRQRPVLFPELDKVMQLWTCQAVTAGIPLSDMILQEKGIEFAGSLGVEDKIKCRIKIGSQFFFVLMPLLHYLDNWFRIENQNILLFIDNTRSHFNPKTLEDITNREIPISSDLSENECNSSEEENVAELSKSAQNRKKNKSKKNKKT
ncbi:unnamed protein product [Rhizophagus irregularis]|nr:unnamed protein product [Rhizophagus irregularis]